MNLRRLFNYVYRPLLIVFGLLTTITIHAQNNVVIDFLKSRGQYYAVIACVVVIFLCIIFFMVRLDNSLTKLENHINNGK